MANLPISDDYTTDPSRFDYSDGGAATYTHNTGYAAQSVRGDGILSLTYLAGSHQTRIGSYVISDAVTSVEVSISVRRNGVLNPWTGAPPDSNVTTANFFLHDDTAGTIVGPVIQFDKDDFGVGLGATVGPWLRKKVRVPVISGRTYSLKSHPAGWVGSYLFDMDYLLIDFTGPNAPTALTAPAEISQFESSTLTWTHNPASAEAQEAYRVRWTEVE